ncbi:MAG: YCF48-related protein, partial [Patescibacteria group bacterium]|nr:YCF48-related protein [Patescibacteria group bacterium]
MSKKLFFILIIAFLMMGGVGCIQVDFGGSGTGNDGGIFKSADKGVEWMQKVRILTTGERIKTIGNVNVLTLVMDPQDSRAIYLGSEKSGLFYSYDGGESWSRSSTLQRGAVPSVAIAPDNKCTVYAAYENKVIKSIDCSRTWQVKYFESRTDKRITSVAIDPRNASVIYAGSSSGDVLKSSDAGVSWTPISRFQNQIKKILIAPYNSTIVYVATASSGMFKTTNGGGSWDELAKNFSQFSGSRVYQDLQFDLSGTERLVYASKFGLLKTNDGGATWNQIELLTPPGSATIYSLGVNPRNGNDIFYSTGTTFYKTLDGGEKWITKKLPTSRVGSVIMIDPTNPNVVYMGVR